MDFTPLIHAAISSTIQILWALATGDWVTGGLIGLAFWCGREHAQAEDRYIKASGTNRAGNPWYIGLKPEAWNKGSVLDIVVPFVFCLSTYLVVSRLQLLGINVPILFGG